MNDHVGARYAFEFIKSLYFIVFIEGLKPLTHCVICAMFFQTTNLSTVFYSSFVFSFSKHVTASQMDTDAAL